MRKIACAIWLSLCALGQAGTLEFKKTSQELHAPADAKVVSADFEFTNKTDKPVSVSRYESTCSCMAVKIKDGKLRYAPGESGLIRAEFDMGNFSGEVDKVVALWLDDAKTDKPTLSLTVRVHIPVLIALEPKTLKWDLGGKAEPQVIKITMNHSKPIKVTSVTSSSDAFKTQLKTVEEGKSYELSVTPDGTGTPGLAIFRVETDCDIAKHRLQQAFGVIRKPTPAETAGKP